MAYGPIFLLWRKTAILSLFFENLSDFHFLRQKDILDIWLTRSSALHGPFFQILIFGLGFEFCLRNDRPKNEQILQKSQ